MKSIYCEKCGSLLPNDLRQKKMVCLFCHAQYVFHFIRETHQEDIDCPFCHVINPGWRLTCENCRTTLQEVEFELITEADQQEEIGAVSQIPASNETKIPLEAAEKPTKRKTRSREIETKPDYGRQPITDMPNPVSKTQAISKHDLLDFSTPKTDEELLKIYQMYRRKGDDLHGEMDMRGCLTYTVIALIGYFGSLWLCDFLPFEVPVAVNCVFSILFAFFIYIAYIQLPVQKKRNKARILSERYPGFNKFFLLKRARYVSYWPYSHPGERKMNEFARICGIQREK